MQSSASSKALFGLCGVRNFVVRQSGAAGCQCRYRCDDIQLHPNVQSPERTKAVTSFYFQPAVDQAASKVSDATTTLIVVDLEFAFQYSGRKDYCFGTPRTFNPIF